MSNDRAELTFIFKVVRGEDDAVAAHQLGGFEIVDLGTEDDKTRRENEKLVSFDIKTPFATDDVIDVINALHDVADMFAVYFFSHFPAEGGAIFILGLSFQKFEHKITSHELILA